MASGYCFDRLDMSLSRYLHYNGVVDTGSRAA
jgi:hypothetical protein